MLRSCSVLAFGVSAFVILSVALWPTIPTRSPDAPTPAGTPAPGESRPDATMGAATPSSAAAFAAPPISLRSADPTALSSGISTMLARSRHLGPAEKDEEDRIGSALEQLLSDQNAAAIVLGFSSAESNTPFGLTALARWTHADPIAAAWWLASRTDSTVEQATVLARELAPQPDLIAVYREQLPAGAWRERFIEAAVLASHASPAQALALAQSLPAGAAQTRALCSLALDWATTDPAAATRWIATVSDESLRDHLAVVAAEAHASADPAGSIAWATATIRSEELFDGTLRTILGGWADSRPSAAAAFIHRLSVPVSPPTP